MKIEKFEDILSWQKARELNLMLYHIYGETRDFVFRDQILRAALSIMNNIAEGYDRRSDKQFVYFLSMAMGSCGEVRSMNILGKDLSKLSVKDAQQINDLCVEISKLITGLIKALRVD